MIATALWVKVGFCLALAVFYLIFCYYFFCVWKQRTVYTALGIWALFCTFLYPIEWLSDFDGWEVPFWVWYIVLTFWMFKFRNDPTYLVPMYPRDKLHAKLRKLIKR